MTLPFYKYHGTGNDFIMVDNRKGILKTNPELIATLCHRRFGIGADGLILIEDFSGADFNMLYFNADGTQSLCGNGSRCAVAFARQLNIITDSTRFNTIDGLLSATIADGLVKLGMNDVSEIQQKANDAAFLNTGSPHYIQWTDEVETLDVVAQGRAIRYSEEYSKAGTNVNFVAKGTDVHSLTVRTYERGVEDETYSCGTGVTAAALAASLKGLKSPVNIQTKGGILTVYFNIADTNNFTEIYLEGPAVLVYHGNIEVPSDL